MKQLLNTSKSGNTTIKARNDFQYDGNGKKIKKLFSLFREGEFFREFKIPKKIGLNKLSLLK